MVYIRFHLTMDDKRLQTALNWLKRCKTVAQFKALVLSKEESSAAVILELITEPSQSRRNGQRLKNRYRENEQFLELKTNFYPWISLK